MICATCRRYTMACRKCGSILPILKVVDDFHISCCFCCNTAAEEPCPDKTREPMRINNSESMVLETKDGSQFRISVDAECGDHGVKITALDGSIFSAQIRKDQVIVKLAVAGKK